VIFFPHPEKQCVITVEKIASTNGCVMKQTQSIYGTVKKI